MALGREQFLLEKPQNPKILSSKALNCWRRETNPSLRALLETHCSLGARIGEKTLSLEEEQKQVLGPDH